MRCVAGQVYRPGQGWREGWVALDGARIAEVGEGAPPLAPEATGHVLPAPVDAHTHVGDGALRGHVPPGIALADLVAPPDGLKHRLLRETPEAELLDGMRRALAEMHAAGSRAFLDFRERGLAGLALLRRAAEGRGMRPVALGRCEAAFDEDEAARVLEACDGYGWSGLGDARGDAPERAARLASRMGKRFALHLSEGAREDAARALDLRPSFLVHGVHCTDEDAARIAAARVPLVLCPRSNARFGPLPDVPTLLRAGVPLALGSDNAMLHPLDVVADARLLCDRFPEVEPHRFLDAAVMGGRLVLDGEAPADPWQRGRAEDVVVMDGDPLAARAPRVTWRSWTKG